MKRLLLSLALLAAAWLPACADDTADYSYLCLYTTSGSTTSSESVALRQVKRLTFEGTDLVVTMADGTIMATPLALLSRIAFNATADAVRSTDAARGGLMLQGGRLVAEGQGTLCVYDLRGQLLRVQHVRGTHAELSLTDLPRGVYVATLGTSTIKFAR